MNSHFFAHRVRTGLMGLCLGAALGIGGSFARAEDAKLPVNEVHKRMLARMAIQQEIAGQPQGIHKISDGQIVIKSGPGSAVVHADLRGCGTGCNVQPGPGPDCDMMAGIFIAFFSDPQEAANMGISPALGDKIKKAYGYIDYEKTNPNPVLKVYTDYAKAAEGKAKADAEKVLMEKVKAVGQAYIDSEAKKLKDIKALLTPGQIGRLQWLGAKMLRPFEKPVA